MDAKNATSNPELVGKKTECQQYLECIRRAQTGKGLGGQEKLLLLWQETEN